MSEDTNKEEEEAAPEEDPFVTLDVNDMSPDCMDDPVLVILTRQSLDYENNALLLQYAAVCTECCGDKRVPGHENLKGTKASGPLCTKCGGTARIPRTSEEDE